MSRRAKWLIRAAYCALVLLCVVLFRGALLTGIAELWIVREPVAKADAVIVLGGGLETRPFAAARLYHAHRVPRILVAQDKVGPAEKLGVTATHTELVKQVLLKQGVPAEAIVLVGRDVTSTYEESVAMRNWIRANHAGRVIVPTELFHTRRVKWMFSRLLRNTGTGVQIETLDPLDYTSADWWQHEEGLIAFQNEVIKYLYYRLKY